MSEYVTDTPSVARLWCPGCEPEADALAEVLELSWCALRGGDHSAPSAPGSADPRVDVGAYLSGTAEAGGEDNRRWCALIHGGARA